MAIMIDCSLLMSCFLWGDEREREVRNAGSKGQEVQRERKREQERSEKRSGHRKSEWVKLGDRSEG